MLRLYTKSRRAFPPPRTFSHLSPENSTQPPLSTTKSKTPPNAILHKPKPLLFPLHPPLSRKSLSALSALSATLICAATTLHLYADDRRFNDFQQTVERANGSLRKIFDHMKQTGVAASVLLKSLASVLSTANHEVRSGFELRVAALLADISAANESRRSAIVSAGGGAVVDWLLETVASSRDPCGVQAESARALAYLIADPKVCEVVLGRPHAVPNLLRFIFSFQPQRSKKPKHSSLDGADNLKGRSMLVAAIMDIITSNCDNIDRASFRPSLPGHADMGDIAIALQVVEEGCMHLDEPNENDDEDGEKGTRGIGIKILGGTTVLGFSRTTGLLKFEKSDASDKHIPKTLLLQSSRGSSPTQRTLSSVSVPGLWDDLQVEHVAVPFAAWALANWALASNLNRSHILDLDRDGHAVMTALMAPERTVKWHGSLVARFLLEDQNLPLVDSVPDWSSSLLSTVSQASKTEDNSLAHMSLSAFLVSVERCTDARIVVMEKGLHLMREIAKQTEKHRRIQEALVKALELICSGNMHLSLEESQKWSGILLPWVCGRFSSDATRFSATKILSCILEDYGPASIPISQGWLTILLTEVLGSGKTTALKGNTQLKSDQVKTQIDHSNALSAAQIANQLAGAVVNLAGNQLGTTADSVDRFPFADLLSLEPFSELFKNMKKDSLPKFDAADSALATLKGIKALAEICAEDSAFQNKVTDFGVLCLLRRFLLRDDYEQLAAIEAYDASRVLETQDRGSNVSGEASVIDSNDPSSVRVPPTGHIRRHAARLLTILSALPKVKKVITMDEIWCKWLEDCANGRIPGCNDLKIQSYARATLLNIFCSEQIDENAVNDNFHDMEVLNHKNRCPRYDDMIFLINPDLPHWKCPGKNDLYISQPNSLGERKLNSYDTSSLYDDECINSDKRVLVQDMKYDSSSTSVDGSDKSSQPMVPLLDIVFVHGLRGGPFKTWRIADNKSSTTSKSGLVEKIDQEAGLQGTCWPREWLAADFPYARLFTVKYKTNLTQWSGASLPLQEVSSMLLKKLVAAGIGNRPVVFVTHSMGGLVVKQMLHQAKMDNFNKLVDNTIGVVFYSCPHFGSKLADVPWRMGLVFRPAPSIGELRSGSPRLVELNDFVRHLHNKGQLDVLSFSETQVTPIVEGYGGWAFRMEIVPIESAYPGFGELVVLDSTDHINSCKPVSHTDPSYTETLEFLQKLMAHYT